MKTDWQVIRELQALDDDGVKHLAECMELWSPAPLWYLQAGISFYPVRIDGTKRPAVSEWKPFQSRHPYLHEIYEHYQHPRGIACICGRISNGLQCLDFDDYDTYLRWSEIPAVREVRKWLIVVESARRPLNGFHVIFRCDKVARACDLAKRKSEEKGNGQEAIIEFKGEGSTFIGVGSAPETHKSGFPYMQVAGPIFPGTPPTISDSQRAILIENALKFDQLKSIDTKAKRHRQRQQRPPTDPAVIGTRPGDLLNATDDWELWLELWNWKHFYGEFWTRPGKDTGVSARLSRQENRLRKLTVFTSSSELSGPSESHTSHSLFSAFATMHHGEDMQAAAKDLAAKGFAKP